MDDIIKTPLTIIILILFLPFVLGSFPGLTPSTLSIESVQPGETVDTVIYLYEDIEPNQTVQLDVSVNEISSNTLFGGRYPNEERISEESIRDWWEFEVTELDNEHEFSPEESDEVFNGMIEVTLDVPTDAEPGLRYGRISISPELETGEDDSPGGQLGFAFSPNLPYNVEIMGETQRDLVVQDVRGFRTDSDTASVEVLLRNTGTVTTSTEDFELKILDGRGEVRRTLNGNSVTLEPGESEWVAVAWSGDNVEEGSFQVDGEINYFTGSAYASGSFSLGDILTVEEAPDDSPITDDENEPLPIWLVLMILVVLGALMWSFEIDPVWIFGIVGIFGISAFILMSNISNLLLAGILIPVLLIVYLGV